METTDEGLTINSNMVTDGFEILFRWGIIGELATRRR